MKVVVHSKASRALARIPEPLRSRIRAKIEHYADDPARLANQVARLKGRPCFRLRVGDYRVIFGRHGGVIEILVIGHRRDVYD